jgi:superfamily II DNA or RNA helicase
VSLVRHILDVPSLSRVLIADEVGLGKTVEVGLLLQELFRERPGLRVLYLAPARLVSNVGREFDRLGLGFRLWKSVGADAKLDTDSRIIASIHRAVHGEHFERIVGTAPWDVLIVDECHHLSDWAPGGGDPVQKFRLVRQLVARQPRDARLILLSGTPHQGHRDRFKNLLDLLRAGDEPDGALEGRVIYRTKEDIQDWDGAPLFPSRQVNEPLIVDLGPEYTDWLHSIHEYFTPSPGGMSEARRRASAWRCAQALQWAASSPQAGLGYLVRQCVRAGWSADVPELRKALAALRPYRLGPEDEPVTELHDRIVAEVGRQLATHDVDDIDEQDDVVNDLDRQQLAGLLLTGIALATAPQNAKWERLRRDVLDLAPGEKFVLFAQPIETVTSLAHYLARTYGERPALIVGGQSDAERDHQVAEFLRPSGPRFLISSRAGGEGINLQVARHLVHLDVPWNPMEMEQRVGRVHRFGSKRTIVVDTLVVRNSRETHAWNVARRKLELVARSLVAPERFETVFSRVMCLVPPEELQTLLLERPAAPLSSDESDRLSALVEAGFRSWNSFHAKYSENQKRIRALSPGLATWADLRDVLIEFGGAKTVAGFRAGRFVRRDRDVEYTEADADVLELSDSTCYLVGDSGAAILSCPEGSRAGPLGLNIPTVSKLLRSLGLPEAPTGAAYLRWPEGVDLTSLGDPEALGILVYARLTLRAETSGTWSEIGTELVCYAVLSDGSSTLLTDRHTRRLALSDLRRCGSRMKAEDPHRLVPALRLAHASCVESLRMPTDADRDSGKRYALFPLLAAVVTR